MSKIGHVTVQGKRVKTNFKSCLEDFQERIRSGQGAKTDAIAIFRNTIEKAKKNITPEVACTLLTFLTEPPKVEPNKPTKPAPVTTSYQPPQPPPLLPVKIEQSTNSVNLLPSNHIDPLNNPHHELATSNQPQASTPLLANGPARRLNFPGGLKAEGEGDSISLERFHRPLPSKTKNDDGDNSEKPLVTKRNLEKNFIKQDEQVMIESELFNLLRIKLQHGQLDDDLKLLVQKREEIVNRSSNLSPPPKRFDAKKTPQKFFQTYDESSPKTIDMVTPSKGNNTNDQTCTLGSEFDEILDDLELDDDEDLMTSVNDYCKTPAAASVQSVPNPIATENISVINLSDDDISIEQDNSQDIVWSSNTQRNSLDTYMTPDVMDLDFSGDDDNDEPECNPENVFDGRFADTSNKSGQKNSLLSAAINSDKSVIELDLNQSFAVDQSRASNDFQQSESLPNFGSGTPKFVGMYQNNGNDPELKLTTHPHCAKLRQVFSQVFKLKMFRTNQFEAINAAMLKNDVFILMPTGGGKSLCYQLPALISEGVTFVVSPLKSLIHDQMTKMNEKQPGSAASLSGDISSETFSQISQSLKSPDCAIKIVFVTPEKISSSVWLGKIFQTLYATKRLARFVIDEAHCVSQWGHDFRPDYTKLSKLRNQFSDVPFMALTATATQKVRLDINKQLSLRDPKWFMQSFNRANLKFEVRPKVKACLDQIITLLQQNFPNQSGIIYCFSRKDCESVSKQLRSKRIQAQAYHAGMADDKRRQIQEMWLKNKFRIVVATIAFGMGVDKPDVRFVIHHSIPKSIEGYYQEVGRAGRDGRPARCILYYTSGDVSKCRTLLKKSDTKKIILEAQLAYLDDVQVFCENRHQCRRVQLLKYFGEIYDPIHCRGNHTTACDNCLSDEVFVEKDVTHIAKAILTAVKDIIGPRERKQNVTVVQLVGVLIGKEQGNKNLSLSWPVVNICKEIGKNSTTAMLRDMICKKYLAEDTVIRAGNAYAACNYIRIGEKANEILNGQKKLIIVHSEKKKTTSGRKTTSKANPLSLSTEMTQGTSSSGAGYSGWSTASRQAKSNDNFNNNNEADEFDDDWGDDVILDGEDEENYDYGNNSLDDFIVPDHKVDDFDDDFEPVVTSSSSAGTFRRPAAPAARRNAKNTKASTSRGRPYRKYNRKPTSGASSYFSQRKKSNFISDYSK